MIDSYVREKTDLYARDSVFSCNDACPRYGCRGDLVVSASLLEMYLQSRFLRVTLFDLFNKAFEISPSLDEGLDRARLRFRLKKPCPFLENEKACGIYPLRPAPCALFPEHLGLLEDGERRVHIERSGIGHYPCVDGSRLLLSEAREAALRHLWRLHTTEIFATDIYLFDVADFSVDLREALLEISGGDGVEIPYRKSEEALASLLAARGLDDRIGKKMGQLETDEGLQRYWSAMTISEVLVEGGGRLASAGAGR